MRVSVMMRVGGIITPYAEGSTMRQMSTVGIDTAKQVFQLHGVDAQGHVVLHKRVTRKQVLPLLAQMPPCLVSLEACGGSHYWARESTKLGHEGLVVQMKLHFERAIGHPPPLT